LISDFFYKDGPQAEGLLQPGPPYFFFPSTNAHLSPGTPSPPSTASTRQYRRSSASYCSFRASLVKFASPHDGLGHFNVTFFGDAFFSLLRPQFLSPSCLNHSLPFPPPTSLVSMTTFLRRSPSRPGDDQFYLFGSGSHSPFRHTLPYISGRRASPYQTGIAAFFSQTSRRLSFNGTLPPFPGPNTP